MASCAHGGTKTAYIAFLTNYLPWRRLFGWMLPDIEMQLSHDFS
jgi:hypothetical protein